MPLVPSRLQSTELVIVMNYAKIYSETPLCKESFFRITPSKSYNYISKVLISAYFHG